MPATPASRPWRRAQDALSSIGWIAAATDSFSAALYRIAITQARYYAPAREDLDRKRSEGKSRREALRRLNRLLVRVVFNTLKTEPALT